MTQTMTTNKSKTNEQIMKHMNENALEFIRLFKGKVIEVDQEAGTCSFEFEVDHQYCHSGDIVQGGFVTFMMDATMSHAIFGARQDVINVSTLEIKTTFLEASRAGKFVCKGKVLRTGRSIGFMEAELFDPSGRITAMATTTAKLVLPR